MTTQMKRLTVTWVLVLLAGSTAWAQEQPEWASESVPLNVQVVISRYQGDEVVSSLPYRLSVTVGPGSSGGTNLRMGAEVPVLTVAQPASDNPGPVGPTPFSYRPVGTQIACMAERIGPDQYRLRLNIEESSVYGDGQTSLEAVRAPGVPVFRSYESNSSLILRAGQSSQYTAAADRLSGESIRVDVTLTVLE